MKLGKLVVFENGKSCSYCKQFNKVLASEEVKRFLSGCGAELVVADVSAGAKQYAALKKKYGFSGNYPGVYVVGGDGATLGKFTARGYTAKRLIEAVEKLCPCDNGSCADTSVCPACGGTGRVAAACLALMLAFCSACSTISVTVAPQPAGCATNALASAEQSSLSSSSNALANVTARTVGSVAVTVNMNTYKNITPVTDLTIPLK